ncbi:MAG: hypothetical protein VYC39_03005 [Myxococcota bacterium]|nr:hypothetical protein [Myxococcota bacterium]
MKVARSDIMRILERGEFSLDALDVFSTNSSEININEVLSLSRKLPTGFIHADALWFVDAPPVGLEPLASGSAWYAVERDLLVVVPGAELWRAVEVVEVVYAYFKMAKDVYRRLQDIPNITELLLSPGGLDPENAAKCALSLGAQLDIFEEIEQQNPDLRFDLGWMGRREFSPKIRVHERLSSARSDAASLLHLERVLDGLPDGRIRLVVSDSSAVFDVISPYPRDLSQAICQWAKENVEALLDPSLQQAVVSSEGASEELASSLLPDLFRMSPELLEERRRGERQAGLQFAGDKHLTVAWSYLADLKDAAPSIAANASACEPGDILVVLSSRRSSALVAAVKKVLLTRKVIVVGASLSAAKLGGPEHLSVSCLTDADAGVENLAQGSVLSEADHSGIEIESLPRLDLDDSSLRFNFLSHQIAHLVHRQMILNEGEYAKGSPRSAIVFYSSKTRQKTEWLQIRENTLQSACLISAAVLRDQAKQKVPSKYLKSGHFRV